MDFDSKILVSLEEDLLNLCEFKLNLKLVLLYRGTKHGFGASDFHSKCDNIPKTLTLVKSTNGNIFGGYTENTWDMSGESKPDANAFIFSLVNNENKPVKVNVANEHVLRAISCFAKFGPIFGGDDICINDNSNASNTNIADFSHYYVLDQYPWGSTQAKSFLVGSKNFTVEEIEVFQIC